MKRRCIGLILILILMIFTGIFGAEPVVAKTSDLATAEQETQEFDGYLVCISDRNYAHLMGAAPGTSSPANRLVRVDTLEEAEQIRRSVAVEYIEPNYIADLFADDIAEEVSDGWPYEVVHADYAAEYGLDGSGVRIAIIDSGLDLNNADLTQASIAEGYDYIADSAEMQDDIYHGTAIAQVIAADRNSIGVTGAAGGATIVPLRCFSSKSGGGTVQMLAQAIYDAVDIYHCDIINMSWGFSSDTETLYDAIRYAYDAGVILVAASGNVSDKYPQGTTAYPAAYDEVISVAAVDHRLDVLETSLANAKVVLCAPGGYIPFVDEQGRSYTSSGTSFAAPYIASAAVILKQLAPVLDNETIAEVMIQRAVDLGDAGRDNYFGYGFISLDLLIATNWSHRKYNSLQGWCVHHGGCRITCASYNDKGRFTDVWQMSVDTDFLAFDGTIESEKNDSFLIMYTDGGYRPLSEGDRY